MLVYLQIEFKALALAGPTSQNPILDPLAVPRLNNQLYISISGSSPLFCRNRLVNTYIEQKGKIQLLHKKKLNLNFETIFEIKLRVQTLQKIPVVEVKVVILLLLEKGSKILTVVFIRANFGI